MNSARVERHTSGPDGQELATFVIEFPRVVLAEVVTHRLNSDTWGCDYSLCERTTTPDISKNSASSRAIPHARMMEKIVRDPYMPAWTGTKAGMQGDPVSDEAVEQANAIWIRARDDAIYHAGRLNAAGIHKQDGNRLLEPWAWVTQVVTATVPEWGNFFTLRCHTAAHPAFRTVARMMFLRLRESRPTRLKFGQWHLPFVPLDDSLAVEWMPPKLDPRYNVWQVHQWLNMPIELRRSVARCAWVSYDNADKDATDDAVNKTVARVVESRPMHSSPLEHQATPTFDFDPCHRSNLSGYVQLRKLLPAERAVSYNPGTAEIESWPEYHQFIREAATA